MACPLQMILICLGSMINLTVMTKNRKLGSDSSFWLMFQKP